MEVFLLVDCIRDLVYNKDGEVDGLTMTTMKTIMKTTMKMKRLMD